MATSKQKVFCVLQFAKTETAITVQRAFCSKFGCRLPNDNILGWFHQFETLAVFVKGKVTPLLTLKEINNSQDEMSYITRMRNIIKFQIASNEDYEYYQKAGFYSELTCHKTHESLLEACLSHALKTVVKYHEVVHNLELFRQWDIISIDVDGFPVIRRENVEDKAEEYIQRNLFLVAAFSYSERHEFGSDWYTYYASNRRLFTDIHLDDRQISDADYLSLLGKSFWRRLNDNNLSFFSCSEKGIAAYVKEQTKMRTLLRQTVDGCVCNGLMSTEAGKKQDNARPHVAKTIRDFCSAQYMQLLPWSAYSPNMLPIKYAWDSVGWRLARDARPFKGRTFAAHKAISNCLSQADLQNLFDSMPYRIAALIAVHSGYTKY
ncbi:uncharacterized protein TNCV_3706471 [Trichonephila clavipes]|nr:uncharacterized protein TNCV_3706471 [Trichonephila clavipes]